MNEEPKESKLSLDSIIESTPNFLTFYDQIDDLFLDEFDDVYLQFYNQLNDRTKECDVLLSEVSHQMGNEETSSNQMFAWFRSTTVSMVLLN